MRQLLLAPSLNHSGEVIEGVSHMVATSPMSRRNCAERSGVHLHNILSSHEAEIEDSIMSEVYGFRQRLQIIKQSNGIVCRITNISHSASSTMCWANKACSTRSRSKPSASAAV
jgi:hypothetical protein